MLVKQGLGSIYFGILVASIVAGLAAGVSVVLGAGTDGTALLRGLSDSVLIGMSILGASLVGSLLSGALLFVEWRKAKRRQEFYVSILDAVAMPISVTDNDMNWTFVNKAVESMINVKREDVYGMHCSNWNADICNTEKCGIAMLKKGFSTSDFVNGDSDQYFRTTVSRMKDHRGTDTGFIEIVSDVDAEVRIKNVAKEVRSAVAYIHESSSQVASASQGLSQGATEQAASLEEISASTNEVNAQTTNNADNAREANSIAEKAASDAQRGSELMSGLIDAMKSINDSAEDIRKIVKVVDDIAFQINLLALNANVEAARAGKYGKGFAVVAEEVRNLAAKSAQSAKETEEMVEASISNIGRGNEAAELTSSQLEAIVDGATKVAVFLSEIATSSQEQATGLNQIQSGLEQIDQVTQANTASAEESAAASEELAAQANQLNALVARFGGADVEATETGLSAEMGRTEEPAKELVNAG